MSDSFTRGPSPLLVALAAAWIGACGSTPTPAPAAPEPPRPRAASKPPIEDCVEDPKPLERQYTSVAAKARCQREVYTIMDGITHFLGVKCRYCHAEPDYRAMTHNKYVANWMAQQLIPRLAKKDNT